MPRGQVVNKHSPFETSKAGFVTFTVGAEGSNTIGVSGVVKDPRGRALTTKVCLPFYLSADSDGNTIATAPSSGIAIGTNGLLIEHTNNLAGLIITEDDGTFDITFSEAGALTNYLNVILPDGFIARSGAITFI